MILEQFYPHEWLNSTYEIPWEQWQKKGIRGVIFDIDNTLVEHGAPADKRAVKAGKKKLSPGDGADGNRQKDNPVCGRSAVYRCLRGQSLWDLRDFSEAY